ncbi:MAG TPA: hypothetical protein DDW51_05600, partial [Cyanobacteria bacterium UBA11367]|nr:hypothetical protein [Cyanobacteria bacterium UBA11367]
MNITTHIAVVTGQPSNLIKDIWDAFGEAVKEALKTDQSIEMPFGTIYAKNYEDSIRKNPRTGEEYMVSARRLPKIKFSNDFVKAIQAESNVTPPTPPTPPT